MFRLAKLTIASLMLGPVLFLMGCQSSGVQSPASAGPPSTQAVYCDQCKVTWVQIPDGQSRGRVWGYHMTKHMECQNCRDAVSNFFANGKLAHSCSTCGGNMSICEAH